MQFVNLIIALKGSSGSSAGRKRPPSGHDAGNDPQGQGSGAEKRSKSVDPIPSTSGTQGGNRTPPGRILPANISTPDIMSRRGLSVSSRQTFSFVLIIFRWLIDFFGFLNLMLIGFLFV